MGLLVVFDNGVVFEVVDVETSDLDDTVLVGDEGGLNLATLLTLYRSPGTLLGGVNFGALLTSSLAGNLELGTFQGLALAIDLLELQAAQ